jgi:outer membrane protein assembly factor BamA
MKPRVVALVAALLTSIGGSAAWPQELPPHSRLASVDVIGAERVGKPAVIEVTGLHVGAGITLADLQAASDRIAKTGLVSGVSFRYNYRGTDVAVTFTIVEARLGLPVLFDNFPWFTDEELTRAVAAKLPGFNGRLPETNEAMDRVTEALAERLKTQGVRGGVQNIEFLDMAHGNRVHLFKVEGVPLPVCALAFPGVQPSLENQVQQACKALVGRELSRNSSASFLAATLVPIYRERGYLRAQLLETAATLGSASTCASGVVLSATVKEGLQYSWKGAQWVGNEAMTTADLDALLSFAVGDVANGVKLDGKLRDVAREYGRRGFIDARTRPVPQFDDAARTVTYEMSVTEGAQFRMGVLNVVGVPDGGAKKIRSHWALAPGAVFDAEYPAKFWSELRSSERELLATLGTVQWTNERDDAARRVDVTFSFTAPKR